MPGNDVLSRREVSSPIGRLILVASERGLRALLWSGDDAGRVSVESVPEVGEGANVVLDRAAGQLAEYFAGERRSFDVPLDLRGSDFQLAAWGVLRTIPYGSTMTYAEQAAALGDRRKARAVGSANGRNPIGIIVPCHRVIGGNGSLTGFAGGLDSKRFLLELEAVARSG